MLQSVEGAERPCSPEPIAVVTVIDFVISFFSEVFLLQTVSPSEGSNNYNYCTML